MSDCGSALNVYNKPGLPWAQTVKSLPAMQETWVHSLGWDNPLEEGMATHSSILAWRILWTEKSGGLQGCEESDMAEATQHAHTRLNDRH